MLSPYELDARHLEGTHASENVVKLLHREKIVEGNFGHKDTIAKVGSEVLLMASKKQACPYRTTQQLRHNTR